MTEPGIPQQLTEPAYPAAEAGRLAGLAASRVRRWLKGYAYRCGDGLRSRPPVLNRQPDAAGKTYASFLELMDLLFIKQFVDCGLSLQKVRRALGEVHEILGTKHFARETFFTDGSAVFLQIEKELGQRKCEGGSDGAAILQLLTGGQGVIAPVIQQLAKRIDFGRPEGVARRWYPLGRDKPVVLDPFVAFGAPSVAGRGIKTSNVHDLFLAERESHSAVRRWWDDLTNEEIDAAVEFETGMAA